MRHVLATTCILFSLCCSGSVQALDSRCACNPTFRELWEEVTKVELGAAGTLYVNVALVGCKENLVKISEAQMRRLQEEFRNPAAWAHVDTIENGGDAELRAHLASRINKIIGAERVSTVLVHSFRRLAPPTTR